MKKLFYLFALSLLVVACKQTPDQLVLKASGLSMTNDLYVYDMSTEATVDTIKITDGGFTYTQDVQAEPQILVITDNQGFYRYLVVEKGNLTLAGDTGSIKGAPLNDRLLEFTNEYKNKGRDAEEKKMAIVQKAQAGGGQPSEQDMMEYQMITDAQNGVLLEVVKKFYETDKNSVIGGIELMFALGAGQEEEFLALYEQGGDAVKNFGPIKKYMEMKANVKKTEVGAKAPDFQGVNPTDTAQVVKLSDFVGKDKYVLLDFWASWCGPCRAAMPELKKLNEKYASKGLEIVGVVVSDELNNHLKAAQDLGVTWPQIFDNKNALTTLYGIQGIPTMILLDKDGTILVRTHEKEEVVAKIESLLGK